MSAVPELLAQQPLLAAAAFFVGSSVFCALSLPGGAAITLAAGGLFGPLWATVLMSFASTLGATAAFLASRFALRGRVRRMLGPRLEAMERGLERRGALYLVVLRLVPAVPFAAVNLGMGLTRMPLATYWWASQLGMLAGTFVTAQAGAALAGMLA